MVEFLLAAWFLQAVTGTERPAVCVEKIRGEAVLGALAEDALAAALLSTRRVRLTENCQKAEYVLKGSIVERADLRARSEGEATGIAAAGGAYNAAGGGFGAMAAAGQEALATTETKRSVTLIVKLVRADGEIPFAGTQDSAPSKNRSAVSEAADRLAREIVRELFPAPPPISPEGRYQKIQ